MNAATLRSLWARPLRPGTLSGWTGVLGPPVVFLTDLGASYLLSYLACLTGRVWLARAAAPPALLLVAACALALARSRAQRVDDGSDAASAHALLLTLGAWSVALFLLAVLALAAPGFALHPCQQY
jgi:hypothetical protein